MPKFDIYEMITNRFIEALEQNTIPWRMPWNRANDQWPINRVSGKPYRGVNVWLLSMTAAIRGYNSNEWMSYKQALALGGQVRKGEKATPVVFWKVTKYRKDGDDEDRKGFILRFYNVFAVEQCEGVSMRRAASATAPSEAFQPIEAASALVASWNGKPHIRHQGSQACYSPELDIVTMPKQTQFHSPEDYYHTLFHELTHSTGHKSRLDRELGGNMRSDSYAKEELVAEIGASFMSHMCHIEVPQILENQKAYVRHWIGKLKEDPKLILSASGMAQKAVDMIVGTTFDEEQDDEETSPVLQAA